ncbi:tRNA-splicing endonuclease subunit sen34 [Talaromyces proteolyticus]|uniref:tRNA-splicing endonuclease subunit Sen34 n=1 Tax=Talaromyces proteolyticus TaxID=1131652 RepID=A0AAD4L2L3_9EURO|nr:tRNA-splicing endonuclease subunit sen34 [Talaromyces proteolyticus]KAH8705471.1 tRNA-splicing endonuclease subunit sen34 [Talaromyces proteolyticus]
MATVPDLPIPISFISGRHLLFSADAVTYLRREHNICGVLMGTLPHVPQQNVFLGLPLQLMPEEARLLVEQGVARIVDEAKNQNNGVQSLIEADKRRYFANLEKEGLDLSHALLDKKEAHREVALRKQAQRNKAKTKAKAEIPDDALLDHEAEDDSLFGPGHRAKSPSSSSTASSSLGFAMAITPATTFPLIPYQAPEKYTMPLPTVPSSYPVYAHLHSRGFFLTPGLRFGCQYTAYPGDPLRFHSHFLVVGAEWDEEIDLMEIVSGGRLGTGVKKGYLFGGAEPGDPADDATSNVRTFSIEWAGM